MCIGWGGTGEVECPGCDIKALPANFCRWAFGEEGRAESEC